MNTHLQYHKPATARQTFAELEKLIDERKKQQRTVEKLNRLLTNEPHHSHLETTLLMHEQTERLLNTLETRIDEYPPSWVIALERVQSVNLNDSPF
jgi:P2-related tail formation protein